MADNGSKGYYANQPASAVLFVPTGWVILEMCAKGLLIYSVRLSLAFRDDAHKASCEELIGAYTVDVREVACTKQALEVIKPDK